MVRGDMGMVDSLQTAMAMDDPSLSDGDLQGGSGLDKREIKVED